MDSGEAALIGAAIGGGVTLIGSVLTHGIAGLRTHKAARADRVRAARAWREDFYALQDVISKMAESGAWPSPFESSWRPLATDADLLSLSPLFKSGTGWGRVASARRRAAGTTEAWAAGRIIDAADALKEFDSLELARCELAAVDRAWKFEPHPGRARIPQSPRSTS